jgi:topoisomerase-4 subunit B
VDEVVAGNADTIKITLKKNNSITIEDNGRGIPIGINPTTKISTVDTVFTVLHAGGKFEEGAYKTSGGLHGVGASVVNALSKWVTVTVKREGKIMESKFENGGNIVQKLTQVGTTNRTGTTVSFSPDPLIFKNITFNSKMIIERIRESAYLFPNLSVEFTDEITGETVSFKAKEGIKEFVTYINEAKTPLHDVAYFKGKNNDIEVEAAFQYVTATNEIIVSFANAVKTREGGSHETAFKNALTSGINTIARKWNLLKDKDKDFEGDDVREGITAVISVMVPEKLIQYEGQTKNKLYTPEAGAAVKKVFGEKLIYWLEENRKQAEKIIEKALLSRDARVAAKKAREEIKQLKNINKPGAIKSSKLTPAQSRDYANNELFLVEGDSAGGTAKLARDKISQAIFPLRGKVINVEKAKLKDLLANEEISTLIAVCGTGIGSEFKYENLKYNKIIIMTDADVDGSHIQILLVTFFYRFMKPLIEKGHIYIAKPPLYKYTNLSNKTSKYVWDESEITALKNQNGRYEIQRYKGLGEMSAEQLRETTMDKKKREVIQVRIEDLVLAEKNINVLMGDNVVVRKDWIDENIDFTFESE